MLEEQLDLSRVHQLLARLEALPMQSFRLTGEVKKVNIDFTGTGSACATYIRQLLAEPSSAESLLR